VFATLVRVTSSKDVAGNDKSAWLIRDIFGQQVEMNIPDQTKGKQDFADDKNPTGQQAETAEEARKIRRLQLVVSMVMSVIGQDPSLTLEEASELAAGAKRAALAMFPDKELAFDLIYKPRLQRLIRDRFRLQ
jgi:hypothetical protein